MAELSIKEQLHGFVDNLEETLKGSRDVRIECDEIVICGMGGSVIASNIIADCYARESEIPITVVRSPVLPSWVGRNTYVIVTSYSGNTSETLEMYSRARDAGCKIVVISSGGDLTGMAEADGVMTLSIPKGLFPRHSLGYILGQMLLAMSFASKDLMDEVRAIIPTLKAYRDLLESDESPVGPLSEYLIGKVPVICSDGRLKSVAIRWKSQINENSKYVSFCASMPEFNHFGLDSWKSFGGSNFAFIILHSENDPEGKVPLERVVRTFEGNGVSYRLINFDGGSVIEDMFRAIMIGDYVSVRMAEIRKVDPSKILPIVILKARIADHFEDS